MPMDFEKIADSPHLLDILLQMEDVLDSNDVYVFPNWFSGEVVEGPKVRRYWFDMTLRYPISKKPDEQGGKRLLHLGIRVDYEKCTVSDEPTKDGVDPEPTHWDVRISIPSRLISTMNAEELDFYDEAIDVDDVESAQDSGMNDETAYQNPDDPANGEGNEPPMDGEEIKNGGF